MILVSHLPMRVADPDAFVLIVGLIAFVVCSAWLFGIRDDGGGH